MPKAKPITLSVLRKELERSNGLLRHELRKEIQTSGESIKQDLRSEIQAGGKSIKKELRSEIKSSIKSSENRILGRLDTVYEDFESKQAIMAEGIAALNDKVTIVQINVASIAEKLDSLSGRVFFLEQKINPATS